MISTFTYKSRLRRLGRNSSHVCAGAPKRPRTSSLGSTPALESRCRFTHRPQGRVHQTQGCGRQPVMPPARRRRTSTYPHPLLKMMPSRRAWSRSIWSCPSPERKGEEGRRRIGEAEIAATFLLNTKISSQTSQPVYIGETIEAVVKGGDALATYSKTTSPCNCWGTLRHGDARRFQDLVEKVAGRTQPRGHKGTTYHELQTTLSDGQLRIQMSYNGDAEFDMNQMVQLVLGGGVLASFVPQFMASSRVALATTLTLAVTVSLSS